MGLRYNTKHFLCPIRSQYPFGNGPGRVGTQGLFRLCLKTFIAPFLQAPLTASGSTSRDGFQSHYQSLFRYDVCLLSLKTFRWVNDHINGDLRPPKTVPQCSLTTLPGLPCNFKVANRTIKIIKLIYMFAVWEYEGDIRQLITVLNVVKDLSLALWGRLFHNWAPLWQRTVRLRNLVRGLGRGILLAMSPRSYSVVKGLNRSC